MANEILSEFESYLEEEIVEADRDCFRRRTALIDIMQKVKDEKKLAGIK
jgi:hypothetical protein